MTTIFPQRINCIICNAENEIFNLGSTNSFGSPDLDYRPAGMARYTLIYEVQTCLNCGFSAPSITSDFMAFLNVNRQKQKDELNWIKLLLDSKEYKDLLNNEFFPDFSNSFLAASFIQEKLGNYNAAFHLAMKSAWIADDNGNKNAAEFSRNKALKFLDKTTDDFIDQSEKILLKIDLLRRTARFEVAKRLIDQAFIEIDSDEKIFKIISFQNELVFKKDTASHRIGERTAV